MNGTAIQKEKLVNLEAMLEAEIIGQKAATTSVAAVVRRGELGYAEPCRPRGSFLFLGPSGVGKTETAKVFTGCIGGELIVFDMSEFSGPSALQELLGTQGYRGRLEQLLDCSAKTILLDEIEKADRGARDLLLQILGEGRVTLGNGQVVSFEDKYVVLTPNIASDVILKAQRGMRASLNRFVREKAMTFLRPEIYGRIDVVEVFQPLSLPQRMEIGRRFAEREVARLTALGEPAENLLYDGLLALCAGDCDLGVRPLKRRIQAIIQGDLVAKALGAVA